MRKSTLPCSAALALLLLGLPVGCDRSETEPSPPTSPLEPAHVPEDPCGALRASIRVVLTGQSLACETDADCGCYPAMIDCGGVTDTETAVLLNEMHARFVEHECPYENEDDAFNCAPWECTPKCTAGMCSR